VTFMDDQVGAAAPALATLVSAAAADARAWHPLEPYAGVDYKLLWRSGKSVAGLMRIAPGGEVAPHAHVRSHHHLWVVDGEVEMLHERVGPGTYVHIPAHVDHGLRGAGPGACTLLYLYLREDTGP
jgi:mannose-6-phosphate isomerase-like protein (cupin superfamily)